jgi:Skp family chaperone for outer membrane proteins
MNLRKISYVISIFIFSSLPFFSTRAYEQKKSNIAIVDVQMILERSLAVQSVKNRIEEISKNVQKQMDIKTANLKKSEEELSRKRGAVSEKEFEQELLIFNKHVSKLQREAQESKGKIEQAFSEAMNKVHEEMLKIINDLAREKGFEIILPAPVVIYASPSLNITQNIIEKLNQKLKDIPVNYKN